MLTAHSEHALTYTAEPWQQELVAKIEMMLVERRGWISSALAEQEEGREVRVLDYACGPGTVSWVSFLLVHEEIIARPSGCGCFFLGYMCATDFISPSLLSSSCSKANHTIL
jgi:hypothetical protein